MQEVQAFLSIVSLLNVSSKKSWKIIYTRDLKVNTVNTVLLNMVREGSVVELLLKSTIILVTLSTKFAPQGHTPVCCLVAVSSETNDSCVICIFYHLNIQIPRDVVIGIKGKQAVWRAQILGEH